jgi:hypothetical protein
MSLLSRTGARLLLAELRRSPLDKYALRVAVAVKTLHVRRTAWDAHSHNPLLVSEMRRQKFPAKIRQAA